MSEYSASGGHFGWRSDIGECFICSDSETALTDMTQNSYYTTYKLPDDEGTNDARTSYTEEVGKCRRQTDNEMDFSHTY